MTILAGRDAKFWLLSGAFLLTCAALALPQIPLRQDVYDIIAVIDITGSMNTRDVEAGGRPRAASPLPATPSARLAAKLPCQSRLGLGVFTERRAFLLFEPVAVCENYGAVIGCHRGRSTGAWPGRATATSPRGCTAPSN